MMRSTFFAAALCFGATLVTPAVAAEAAPPRALFVVSGEGKDAGKTRPGFEMDEFAQAWAILRDNGFAIDVASPRGGAVEADKYDAALPFNARVLADADATRALAATLSTGEAKASDYAAVVVIGGKGAMFDLPGDRALQSLIAGVWTQGGVVAAVCHGPAALVDVRLADGTPLVAGKALTGFTNEEEQIFGKRWAASFPFLIEDRMRERGARWQEAPLMMPKVVVDGRLVTGQNPYSTPALAEAIVSASGRTPVARTPWRDEATMTLVESLPTRGESAVAAELARDPKAYHIDLIGLLGYYRLKVAADDTVVRDARTLMQLARPYMDAPQLRVGIAEATWRLGDTPAARALVGEVLEAHPDLDEARQLLARLDG